MTIKLYFIALFIFLLIDMLWLGLIAKEFYAKNIGFLMRENVYWPAAIIFYLVFIVGVVIFVVNPAIDRNSWKYALYMGSFFGFVTYATYDLTNLATIKDWPLEVALFDLIWGGTISSIVSVFTYFISKSV